MWLDFDGRALETFIALDLAARARETVGRTGGRLVARAASFMLLADSRASFQIEGQRPPRNRLERWGRAVRRIESIVADAFAGFKGSAVAVERSAV